MTKYDLLTETLTGMYNQLDVLHDNGSLTNDAYVILRQSIDIADRQVRELQIESRVQMQPRSVIPYHG
jgi:hypothetical protein